MVNFGLCNALAVFSNIDSINKHEQYDWTSNFLRSIEIVADNSYYDDEYDNHYNNHPSNKRKPNRRNDRDKGGAMKNTDSTGGWMEMVRNQRQLGAALLGLGLLLTSMGVMLFFEGNLLRLGNICLIAGIFLLIGPSKVSGYFLKESRMQATIITTIGFLCVFMGRPKLGLLIEIFGLLNLFGNMLPVLLAIGKNIPIVGDVISAFDGSANNKQNNNGRAPSRYAPNRDRQYREEEQRQYQPRF